MATTAQGGREQAVRIQLGGIVLEGDLTVPAGARGLVIFAHGSGSSRRSPRNRAVASTVRSAGVGTLLFDLLSPAEEEADGQLRFDIDFLAERLMDATYWALSNPATRALRFGYFGSSTGAAAALVAASRCPELIGAVVSRGGRPDLAGEALGRVWAPTLLLVGGEDEVVLELNEQARRQLRAPSDLVVIPGATHLFAEPGTLEEVARLAADWFGHHLAGAELEERPAQPH